MNIQVRFPLPKNADPAMVAETFAAYLLGSRAFENPLRKGARILGPFWDESIRRWQLDGTNDYWLRFEDGQCILSCRYEAQAPTLHVMKGLFELRMRTLSLEFERGDYIVIDVAGNISRMRPEKSGNQPSRKRNHA